MVDLSGISMPFGITDFLETVAELIALNIHFVLLGLGIFVVYHFINLIYDIYFARYEEDTIYKRAKFHYGRWRDVRYYKKTGKYRD